MSPFRYVRRKDNPLSIQQAGYAESFTGSFDPDLYEEVVGPLPEDAVIEPQLTPLMQIQAVFKNAVTQKPDQLPPSLQKDLLKLADTLERALALELYDAAKEAIKEPLLPAELEAFRLQMLSLIPKRTGEG